MRARWQDNNFPGMEIINQAMRHALSGLKPSVEQLIIGRAAGSARNGPASLAFALLHVPTL
jgi:hypothetical protein